MVGLLGKKIGMSTYFSEDGKSIPCTVIEAGPCVVTQIKTEDTDGYNSVQIGFGDKKEKSTTNALKGHFKAASTSPKRKLVELRDCPLETAVGDELKADLFEEGEFVDVVGTSKGKGFQGVVKRHKFRGVNDATHGQHNRQRHPGSIGAASYPARVFKGMKMGGQMGHDRVTVQNLRVLKVLVEKNMILLKGAIPGHNGSFVLIEK